MRRWLTVLLLAGRIAVAQQQDQLSNPFSGTGGLQGIESCVPLDGTATAYIGFGSCADPTESTALHRIDSPAVFDHLSCKTSGITTNGATFTTTLRTQTGCTGATAATALTCVIGVGADICTGSGGPIPVAGGDCVAFSAVASAAFSSPITLQCSIEGASQSTVTSNFPASTTFLWVPWGHPEMLDTTMSWAAIGANNLECVAFVPFVGITGATKLGFMVWTSGGAGSHVGWAIYKDADSSRIMTTGAVATAASNIVVTATGLTPYSLVAGTKYQLCACTDTAAGSIEALPLPSYAAGRPGTLWRTFVSTNTGASTGGTGCTAGAPAATLPALTGGNYALPVALLSVE